MKNTTKSPWLEPYHWKPGQCGNPRGRPLKQPVTERYLEALEVKLPDEIRVKLGLPKGATMGDAIARRIAIKAANGNVEAAREIADRVEGKPPQAVKLTGDAYLPAPIINVVFGREDEDTTIEGNPTNGNKSLGEKHDDTE